MNEAKLEKQKKKLVKAGLMKEEEVLIDYFQASYVERLIGKMGTWKQAWAYFTEERLILITGLLNDNIIVSYKNIRALGKCSQSLLPIGIVITYEDEETKKTVTDKISMMKRDKWLHFLAEKSGVSVS